MNFLKIIHEEKCRSVNLSNFENVLQSTIRTDRARDCILGHLETQILKISLLGANQIQ